MRKIPTLFVRDPADRKHVTRIVTDGCQWVIGGEGVPTCKIDGTCVKFDEAGAYWKRREVKKGKPAPEGFVQEQFDPETGKTVGWVPVGDGPDDAVHREALDLFRDEVGEPWADTYELVGPKINGNPDGWKCNRLISHHAPMLALYGEAWPNPEPPRDFDGLRDWLLAHDFEGIVWHHEDGRMVKLKKRDFC